LKIVVPRESATAYEGPQWGLLGIRLHLSEASKGCE